MTRLECPRPWRGHFFLRDCQAVMAAAPDGGLLLVREKTRNMILISRHGLPCQGGQGQRCGRGRCRYRGSEGTGRDQVRMTSGCSTGGCRLRCMRRSVTRALCGWRAWSAGGSVVVAAVWWAISWGTAGRARARRNGAGMQPRRLPAGVGLAMGRVRGPAYGDRGRTAGLCSGRCQEPGSGGTAELAGVSGQYSAINGAGPALARAAARVGSGAQPAASIAAR